MCIRDRYGFRLRACPVLRNAGGVSGKALDRFLSERKDTQKVFLCLDSDTAGSEACTLSLIHIYDDDIIATYQDLAKEYSISQPEFWQSTETDMMLSTK